MVKKVKLFGFSISNISLKEAVDWIYSRINSKEGGVVYCCTLNEMRAGNENYEVEKALEKADLLTPDGMPLVWLIKIKSGKGERVYGPDLMRAVMRNDSKRKLRHFFLGSGRTLKKIKNKLVKKEGYGKEMVEYFAPEFKDVFSNIDFGLMLKKIKKFGPDIVWVGMGAEKQINICDQLRKKNDGLVWVTVGAAFDFYAGAKKQAPRWMQKRGMEWLFRMKTEPRRLGERYARVGYFLIKYGINRLLH